MPDSLRIRCSSRGGDGLITGETRCYTEPFEAPAWRAGLVEAIS